VEQSGATVQHLEMDVFAIPDYSADKPAVAVRLLVLDDDVLGKDLIGEVLLGDSSVILAFYRAHQYLGA
jgi:hypothetical protein